MGATRKDGILYHLMVHMEVFKHTCQVCLDEGKTILEGKNGLGKVSQKKLNKNMSQFVIL